MKATFWKTINESVSTPSPLWTSEEGPTPDITTRIIRYLITYYESGDVAHHAVRVFCGVEESSHFAGWSETRVASVRQIREVIVEAGGKNHTWELAFTIRDFLQNAYDTIFTVDLDTFKREASSGEMAEYLRQLAGIGVVFKTQQPAPYRPGTSTFRRRAFRVAGVPVLPDFVINYLRYLWGILSTPPLDFHTSRLLTRMGILTEGDPQNKKTAEYAASIGRERPMRKHRNLLTLAKLVCGNKPRCEVCPITSDCATGSKKTA